LKTIKLLLGSLLILGSALPLAAQISDAYVIPASANLAGANNTQWATRFSLFNPHDYALTISVTLVPTGGGTAQEEVIDIPGNASAYSDNLLADLYDVSGGGSLLIVAYPEDNPTVTDNSAALSFLVNSETYNNAPSGTYGQTIPGALTGLFDVDSDSLTAIAHGIRNGGTTGFRTNYGALNLGGCTVTLFINVYDADGNAIAQNQPLTIPALAHAQASLPVNVDAGAVEFYVDDPCLNDDNNYAVVFPYTSTIDSHSGDPSYQSPLLIATPSQLFGDPGDNSTNVAKSKSLARKLDVAYARTVRAKSERRGTAHLTRTAKGLQIKK
jgi:hypothetical protein